MFKRIRTALHHRRDNAISYNAEHLTSDNYHLVKSTSLFPEVGDPYRDLAPTRPIVHKVTNMDDTQPIPRVKPIPQYPQHPRIPFSVNPPGAGLARSITSLSPVVTRSARSAIATVGSVRDSISSAWRTLGDFTRSAEQAYHRMRAINDDRLDKLEARLSVLDAHLKGNTTELTRALGHAARLHAITAASAAYLIAQHA